MTTFSSSCLLLKERSATGELLPIAKPSLPTSIEEWQLDDGLFYFGSPSFWEILERGWCTKMLFPSQKVFHSISFPPEESPSFISCSRSASSSEILCVSFLVALGYSRGEHHLDYMSFYVPVAPHHSYAYRVLLSPYLHVPISPEG
jgi:hypothetical protein